jgi:hypothetical protein
MAACVTGKKMYLTQEMAEQTLIQAWVKNDFPMGKGPVAVYRCADCGQYHLTSSGQMNSALEQFVKDGKLKLQREADYWKKKLKS